MTKTAEILMEEVDGEFVAPSSLEIKKPAEFPEIVNIVVYDSNNSGGYWWLKDDDWYNLEKAGWVVGWRKAGKRFLGALASHAYREGLSLKMAIAEWETITGQNANDEGCECCGYPHNFSESNGLPYWLR